MKKIRINTIKKENLLSKNILNLGLIGFNKSNGHFFSYPAIINGYDRRKFRNLKWDNIFEYLEKVPKNRFNIKNAKISHVWCQNFKLSKNLSEACYIQNPVKNYEEMLDKVDGIIIARDDWKSHLKISKYFLKKKIKVFVDKPLTFSKKELKVFSKYLRSNLLMSCSSLRFYENLNKYKKSQFDKIKLFTINDFNKYFIHMLEFSFLMGFTKIKEIKKKGKNYFLKFDKGETNINLDNKNKTHKAIIYYKGKKIREILFKDNFYMFKNLLKSFINFCKNKNTYSNKETIKIIDNLIKIKNE